MKRENPSIYFELKRYGRRSRKKFLSFFPSFFAKRNSAPIFLTVSTFGRENSEKFDRFFEGYLRGESIDSSSFEKLSTTITKEREIKENRFNRHIRIKNRSFFFTKNIEHLINNNLNFSTKFIIRGFFIIFLAI